MIVIMLTLAPQAALAPYIPESIKNNKKFLQQYAQVIIT
jgi:hypothetical protein